ncbi:hypothetical protein G6F31_013481 [Rhizopus arrhizus]|nr:hypothetical protein G6F31_013481 [Rhizopus arrhizus]
MAGGHSRLHLLEHLGGQAGLFRQEAGGLECEHAAVPVVAAVVDEALRHLGRRLFDEAAHAAGRRHDAGFFRLDIAVAAERRGRGDAEGHQCTLARGLVGGGEGRAEHLAVLQHVVRRHDQHDGVFTVPHGPQRGRGDRRGGVPREGLQDYLGVLDAQFQGLFGGDVLVGVVAHQHRLGLGVSRAQAQQRVLQQAAGIGQTEELLGPQLARQRPQARTGTAAKDDSPVGGRGIRHGAHSLKQPAVALVLRLRKTSGVQRQLGLVGEDDVMGGASGFTREIGAIEVFVHAARRPGLGRDGQAQLVIGDAAQGIAQGFVLADPSAGHEPGAAGRRIGPQACQLAAIGVAQQQVDRHQRQHLHRLAEVGLGQHAAAARVRTGAVARPSQRLSRHCGPSIPTRPCGR